MSDYKPTIGLEVHAELKTKTKMFCSSANDPDEKRPNVNVCPVCLAHPGTLPVINREAVWKVIMVGRAVGGTIADFTEFDRKNYFYPDLPKGYQISQYKYPIVSGGELSGVKLTRIHLEEDTARSQHGDAGHSLVDFNRAGVPLMELVTEPVIESAKQAGDFARELQLLLRYLDASEANMEKGEMRVEANVSVSKSGKMGTKVEVKNLNSFRAAERAIEYETKRQIEVLESGGKVVQETRGWNEDKGETFSQRVKEESHDYRYFPEPDLPKLYLSQVPEFANMELPELPAQKRERYARDYGIKDEDIESYIVDQNLGRFFESVASELKEKDLIKLASNYITSDLVGLLGVKPLNRGFTPASFANLIKMTKAGEISSRGMKDALRGGAIQKQESDEGELKKIVEQIITDNPKVVSDFKSGKEASLQFLVGQAMKATKGSANPQVLQKIFKEILG